MEKDEVEEEGNSRKTWTRLTIATMITSTTRAY